MFNSSTSTCRRYALIGPNGCGKSSLLKALGHRELPIPDHIDVYHLDREIDATDLTALEAVTSVDEEKARLEKEADSLVNLVDDPDAELRLEDIYERYTFYPFAQQSYLHSKQVSVFMRCTKIQSSHLVTAP